MPSASHKYGSQRGAVFNHKTTPKSVTSSPLPIKRATACHAVASSASTDTQEAEEEWFGPAQVKTLELIDWPDLCAEIAMFASTIGGKELCHNLRPAATRAEAVMLLEETIAVDALETIHGVGLQLTGADTKAATSALKRAEAGGMLDGLQLLAVANLFATMGRITR